MRLRKNYLLAVVRAVVLFAWIVFMPLVFLVAKLLRIPGHIQLPHVFHAGTCRILGIQVETLGEMSEHRPTLYASNHISYIDVFVLGQLPAYFIAKSEVASWPVFGKLATFQNTLFIERRAGKAKHQIDVLRAHLAQGNSLTLFPEGTSTDGIHVEPFKSTLFAAADLGSKSQGDALGAQKVAIQPVSVVYTHHAGQAIRSQFVRDHYAWHRKMPFLPHFLGLLPLKSVGAKIVFHPVCYLEQFENRKSCADYCQQVVAAELVRLVQPELDCSAELLEKTP